MGVKAFIGVCPEYWEFQAKGFTGMCRCGCGGGAQIVIKKDSNGDSDSDSKNSGCVNGGRSDTQNINKENTNTSTAKARSEAAAEPSPRPGPFRDVIRGRSLFRLPSPSLGTPRKELRPCHRADCLGRRCTFDRHG